MMPVFLAMKVTNQCQNHEKKSHVGLQQLIVNENNRRGNAPLQL